MSIWESFLGHDVVRSQMQRAVDRGRLSHAYLFAGPAGVGKKTFARRLAQSLLCEQDSGDQLDACGVCPNCKRFQAGTHPDYYEIACPEGKKSIPVEMFIGDDDHRGRQGLCYELSLRSMASDRKVAVIDDAHLMQSEASNSLLKTLEEPPSNALIVIVTDREEALLPTIRSRCQAVRFQRLTDEQLSQLIQSNALATSSEQVEQLVRWAEGSLEVARNLTELTELNHFLDSHFSNSNLNPLKLAPQLQEWIEAAGESSQQRQAAMWVLRYLGEEMRARVREASQSAEVVDLSHDILKRLREAENQLNEMMPIPLWVEGLVYDLSRLFQTVSTE